MTSSTGTCTVIANLPGNTNYTAAPKITESTTASKGCGYRHIYRRSSHGTVSVHFHRDSYHERQYEGSDYSKRLLLNQRYHRNDDIGLGNLHGHSKLGNGQPVSRCLRFTNYNWGEISL